VSQTSNFERCLKKKKKKKKKREELIEGRWMVIANRWTKDQTADFLLLLQKKKKLC
jgi:hypothetical protein